MDAKAYAVEPLPGSSRQRSPVDTNQGIISQNEVKKIYRAKHAKLAKASPRPRLFVQINLGDPFDAAQDMLCELCARYNLFLSSFRRKNFKYVWLVFFSTILGLGTN